jgi:hypothetical protein
MTDKELLAILWNAQDALTDRKTNEAKTNLVKAIVELTNRVTAKEP